MLGWSMAAAIAPRAGSALWRVASSLNSGAMTLSATLRPRLGLLGEVDDTHPAATDDRARCDMGRGPCPGRGSGDGRSSWSRRDKLSELFAGRSRTGPSRSPLLIGRLGDQHRAVLVIDQYRIASPVLRVDGSRPFHLRRPRSAPPPSACTGAVRGAIAGRQSSWTIRCRVDGRRPGVKARTPDIKSMIQ